MIEMTIMFGQASMVFVRASSNRIYNPYLMLRKLQEKRGNQNLNTIMEISSESLWTRLNRSIRQMNQKPLTSMEARSSQRRRNLTLNMMMLHSNATWNWWRILMLSSLMSRISLGLRCKWKMRRDKWEPRQRVANTMRSTKRKRRQTSVRLPQTILFTKTNRWPKRLNLLQPGT